jgi:hypothetical protein
VLLLGGGQAARAVRFRRPARLRRAAAVAQPPCGGAALGWWAEVHLRGPRRRQSWRCPAAAGRRVRRLSCGRRRWSWPLPHASAAAGLGATQLEMAAASCGCYDQAAGDAAGVGRCVLRVRAPELRAMQLELAVASCGCGGRAAGFAAGVGRCLSFSRAAAGLWATQLELAAASCGCGCQAAGDAAGVGRCLLRVRGQACGRRSWSWPLPLARAAAGLQATQLELAAASSACGGRAAGDAAGVGRCLLRGL